jgi:hypothetical protein
VRPLQSDERLAQRAARKHMAVAKRLERIEQDNVQVSRQPAMLKTVVENDGVAIEFGNRAFGRGDAIWILYMRHVRERLLQFQRLIVLLAVLPTVTPTGDGHTNSMLSEPLCDPFHHRRFAGPAERQIADADYRHAHVMHRGLPTVVTAIPPIYR